MTQIFQLKLKGDTTIITATSVELKVRGIRKLFTNNKHISQLLNSSILPHEIELNYKGTFYPIHNIYLKLYDEYLLEGISTILKGDE